jgi:hypothetical protein
VGAMRRVASSLSVSRARSVGFKLLAITGFFPGSTAGQGDAV